MNTANRGQWKFPYTADKLLAAANTKVEFHKARLAWWEDKKASVLATVKAEGIEIDESVAAGEGYGKSYSRHESVTIRDDLVRDLSECVSKVKEHRGKVADYGGWAEVLASQGQATFDLFQGDWLYFFGKV